MVDRATVAIVEEALPGGICGRKQALDTGRARGAFVGGVGSGVKVVGLPVGSRGTGFSTLHTVEETMAKVTDTTKVVHRKGKLYVAVIKVGKTSICVKSLLLPLYFDFAFAFALRLKIAETALGGTL